MERETLLGEYKPFGAHATVIYETLHEDMGLVKYDGTPTSLGEQVIQYLKEHREF